MTPGQFFEDLDLRNNDEMLERFQDMETKYAIELVTKLIAEADAVRLNTNLFDAWRRKCRTVLDKVFGPNSQQSTDFMGVNFQYYGTSAIGDERPFTRAFESGIEQSKEVLQSIIWELKTLRPSVAAVSGEPELALEFIVLACRRFHAVARQLRKRHGNRTTLDVADEYDVQDLLFAILRLRFDDIRREEWTPSYAGKSSRMDFLLKKEQIVLELKMTRGGLDGKKVGEELTIDIAKYQKHPDCKVLVCFVYGPDQKFCNIGIA